jgi:nanoRNase/pAp phosphatase (c-di-AMP/oligoRNAs hydrolase)
MRNIPKQNKENQELIIVDTPNLDQIHKVHQFNPK